MRPRRFDAIIFDMDGLLIDTERIFRDALIDSAAALGFAMPASLHQQMLGLPGDESDLLLRAFFGPDFAMTDYRRTLLALIEVRLRDGIPIRPGVLELLDFLEARAIPKAVATSSRRQSAERHLARCHLLHRFPVVATRDDVARGKPSPDVYLKAVAGLGVAAERCIALEDSHNGIRAAHAAGLEAIMVPDLVAPTPEILALCADVSDDLHAVRTILEKRLAVSEREGQTDSGSGPDLRFRAP